MMYNRINKRDEDKMMTKKDLEIAYNVGVLMAMTSIFAFWILTEMIGYDLISVWLHIFYYIVAIIVLIAGMWICERVEIISQRKFNISFHDEDIEDDYEDY